MTDPSNTRNGGMAGIVGEPVDDLAVKLCNTDVFADVSVARLRWLIEASGLRSVPAGQFIWNCTRIRRPDACIYVVSGCVDVLLPALPKNAETGAHSWGPIYARHYPGRLTAVSCALLDVELDVHLAARLDTSVLIMPGERVRALAQEFPLIHERVMRRLIKQVRRLNEDVNAMSLDLEHRVARQIWLLADDTMHDGRRLVVTTHEDLALQVRSSKHATTRALSYLRKCGYVETAGTGRLIVTDVDGLRRYLGDSIRHTVQDRGARDAVP